MGRAVGIDLGTTFSAVAAINSSGLPEVVRNAEGQTITPSVVLFEGSDVLVGQQAKAQRMVSPEDVVEFVKRQMGNPDFRHYAPDDTEYTAEGISALILKKLASDAETSLGEPIDEVVITVPAYFNDAQRLATKQAGEIAGLTVGSVINEPTAAAISFAVEHDYNGTVLVYDLGGGTFDVTLLKATAGEFDIINSKGDRNLGGFDFDNRVISWARDQFLQRTGVAVEGNEAEAMLRDRAEQAKHRLSTSDQAPIFVTFGGHNEKLVLTRDHFESLTTSLLERTEYLVEEVLEDSGVPLSQIDKVLLVGGSTRMPMVPRLLQRLTGKTPDQTIHPDEAVARGAAIVATVRAAASGSGDLVPVRTSHDVVINDVVSHGLGVVADNDQHIAENSIIIAANSRIPCQEARVYSTVMDGQTELNVQVTEGDEEDLRYVRTLGNSVLKIPPYPAGAPVQVVFSCDIDGMVHIEVTDLQTGNGLGEFEIDRVGSLDQQELDRMRDTLKGLDVL